MSGKGRVAAPSLFRLGEATPSGPREYAVGGLVECASSVLLIGAPKGGKTAVAVHLAYCIALGRSFLGRRVRRGAVVYIAQERFRETDLRLQTQFGQDASRAPIRITPIRDLFSTTEAAAGLIDAANEFERDCDAPLGLIVIDTLSAVIGDGDENSARDINRMTRNLDLIRERTNAVVLVIHHSKRGETRSRGSESLEAWADLTLAVEAQKGGRHLRVTRSNSIPEGITVPFTLKAVPLGVDDVTGDESSVVLAAAFEPRDADLAAPSTTRKLPPDPARALKALQDLAAENDVVEASEWRRHTLATFGDRKPAAKRQAFSDARKMLVSRRMIVLEGDIVSLIHPSEDRQNSDNSDASGPSETRVRMRRPLKGAGADADTSVGVPDTAIRDPDRSRQNAMAPDDRTTR